jgi:hypothetical protein
MEHRWNETDTGKTEVLGGNTCPSGTLSITDLISTDPAPNPGLRGGRPATNHLNYETADHGVRFVLVMEV